MIFVAAGLIFKDGLLLIAQRPPGKHGALKWEFPGGKIEKDEDPRKTLQREIREELGIEIETNEIVETVFHKYPERSVLLLFYKCRFISGEPSAIDCHDFRWVKPSQLNDFDFLEADLDFIRRLASQL
ncbi:MAG TPA: (deoxy)nucleoside triphosphate pyrophosphohydrolase [Acidobacteriota bacterium]|jgi:mutator protein MutT|nr:(deoxy)nucleoside triphosphate pyrophosphohydrolase [Acidobacteriota bacterium]